ncbi:MAG: hypothetical protein HC884_03770 [Chloroflexaceae bacterium]|nr:hypothetical protein [Chloroflexaceae bacterium]
MTRDGYGQGRRETRGTSRSVLYGVLPLFPAPVVEHQRYVQLGAYRGRGWGHSRCAALYPFLQGATHGFQALGADFVQRILGGVPVGVVEVNQVNRGMPS